MSIEFISGLKFGALGPKTLHLCIDMQLMFALETKWASEAIWRALPAILQDHEPIHLSNGIYAVYLPERPQRNVRTMDPLLCRCGRHAVLTTSIPR